MTLNLQTSLVENLMIPGNVMHRKGEDASEKGFIDSLPSDDRSRARIALRSALVSEMINDRS